MEKGIVYLISSTYEDKVTYKIGMTTRKANNRKNEIDTSNAGTLQVIYEFKSEFPTKLERSLHTYYGFCRLKGEWFSDNLDVSTFIHTCESFEKSFKTLKSMNNPFI